MFIATISTQRSGTKLLGSLLGSSGAVLQVGEIFNPDSDLIYAFRSFLKLTGFDNVWSLGSHHTLSTYFKQIGTLKEIVHFDLMFNQLEHACVSWADLGDPFIYHYMKAMRFSIISLERDPEEVYISNKTLELSKVPHAYIFDKPDEDHGGVISLSRSDFRKFRATLEFHQNLMADAFRDYEWFTVLNYDEIAQGIVPEKLHRSIANNARFFCQDYDWQSFPAPKTKLIKGVPKFDIEWTD